MEKVKWSDCNYGVNSQNNAGTNVQSTRFILKSEFTVYTMQINEKPNQPCPAGLLCYTQLGKGLNSINTDRGVYNTTYTVITIFKMYLLIQVHP